MGFPAFRRFLRPCVFTEPSFKIVHIVLDEAIQNAVAGMITMGNAEREIASRLRQVKDLYAELFMLLVQSIAEDPMETAVGGVDAAIERLMGSIEAHMRGLREAIAAGGPLDPSVDAGVKQFEEQLRAGLEKMVAAVRRRSDELTATRDRIKERLRAVQLKGRGAQGYRSRLSRTSRLIESQI